MKHFGLLYSLLNCTNPLRMLQRYIVLPKGWGITLYSAVREHLLNLIVWIFSLNTLIHQRKIWQKTWNHFFYFVFMNAI